MTVMVTVVLPRPTIVPAAGDWLMVSDADGVQLSLAVTSPVRLGKAIWLAPLADCVRFGAQAVIVGACASSTVTVKAQDDALPAASVAVQLTVVVPFGKNEPVVGEQTAGPASAQLSLTIGAA